MSATALFLVQWKYKLIIKHFGISFTIFEQSLDLGEKCWGGQNPFMQNYLLAWQPSNSQYFVKAIPKFLLIEIERYLFLLILFHPCSYRYHMGLCVEIFCGFVFGELYINWQQYVTSGCASIFTDPEKDVNKQQ